MSIKKARKVLKRISKEYGLSDNDEVSVWYACALMTSDPDGCYSSLEDIAGIYIEYDDIAELCGILGRVVCQKTL